MENKHAIQIDLRKDMADSRAQTKNSSNCDYFWLGWHIITHDIFDPILAVDLSATIKTSAVGYRKENGRNRWICSPSGTTIER